ncbi:MAG: hypothetical protein JWR67_4019 [Mucilaginibacter sp.]|nr:hypothetical protein [Mucilaginibacter sp.]
MKPKLLTCTLVLGLLVAISCSKKEIDARQLGAVSLSSIVRAASPPASYACFTISNVFSSKFLEVRGDSTLMHAQSNPANVQQNASAGSGQGVAGNQKWYLIQQGTGTITSTTPFKIMNVENGLFLEAPNGTSGTTLWVDHSNSFPSQIWNLQLVSGQAYYVIKNSNGLVLTDHGSSTANGAPVTEETATSSTTKYWNLSSITAEAYRDDVVVTFFHRGAVSNTTVAFDQGNSIPLTNGSNNGKVLWITQDAYASSQLQSNGQLFCQFFSYHNSGLLQPSTTNWASASTPNITTTSNASTGINELEIIKSPGAHNSTYTWPGAGVEVGSNVLLNGYESANGSTPANQALYSIAESTSSTAWGAVTRLTPNGMSGQTKMVFSVGMIKKPAGDTVYVYGAQSTFFNANAITLARFPASNPSSWSYWRGHSWASTPDTTSLSGAITVGSGTSTQANVMVSYVNGKYVMMQMDLGYFCDPNPHGIYISTATSPFGPFTAPKLVYTINDWYNGHLAKYYTPIVHGEFVNGLNELLVTYCLNYNGQGGTCSTATCFNNNQDPNYYQVKGVRIPYSIIGL